MTEKCCECRFWVREFGSNTYHNLENESGECHRHAPFVRLMITTDPYHKPATTWPTTWGKHGCGDFEQKAEIK